MADRVDRMYRRIFEVIQEETHGYLNDQLAGLVKSMGIDLSQLKRVAGGQAVDPYLILGLDRSSSDEAVKKRYRQLLRQLHPDTAGVEGTAFLLQMVLGAYEMIRKERGLQ